MYKTLDLFAGAGGLSLGFEMTGQFKTAAIVENNKNAAQTFINNHKDVTNFEDILKLDFEDLKTKIGTIDIVIGGPPCQGFSNANRQRRQLINGSNELVKKYVEAISVLNPKAFVMENVKTIASEKHSFCVTKKDKDYILNDLNIKPDNRSVILYDGKHVSDIRNCANHFTENNLSLLSEEELYVLYNIHKKRKKLKVYFEKSVNRKKIENIYTKLDNAENIPVWLDIISKEVSSILKKLLIDVNEFTDTDDRSINEFWDLQRYYQGILELNGKDVDYTLTFNQSTIDIILQTYIVIDFVKRALGKLGYSINGDVLNAAGFGVPQTRERYILIGVLPEYLKVEEVRIPEPIIADKESYVTVRHAIHDLSKHEPTIQDMSEEQARYYSPKINSYYRELIIKPELKKIYNHVCTATRPEALEKFKAIGPGENFHALPKKLKESYENPDRTQNTVYRRLQNDMPSDTVVNVRKSMWIHPDLDRAISAREAARLQSFPDDYIFYGTKDSVYQQIGNAVPPLLGRAIAEKILRLLGNTDKQYISLQDLYKKYNR